MSRFRHCRRRKLYGAGVASMVVGAAIGMTGCIAFTLSSDFLDGAINGRASSAILRAWVGPTCDQDLNGNGVPGGPQDRAWCAFYIIRDAECNHLHGAQNRACYVATEHGVWDQFDQDAKYVSAHGGCLAFEVGLPDYRFIDWWAPSLDGQAGCVY
jgi:hypothetical protein